jgi:hypothetical protein
MSQNIESHYEWNCTSLFWLPYLYDKYRFEPYKETSAPLMGVSAICDFLRREDELMTELMNHKRSTSY